MRTVEVVDDADELQPEYLDWSKAVRGAFAGTRTGRQVTVKIQVVQLAPGKWRARSDEFPDAIGYGDDADSALDQGEDRIAETVEARVARGEIPPTVVSFAIDYQ